MPIPLFHGGRMFLKAGQILVEEIIDLVGRQGPGGLPVCLLDALFLLSGQHRLAKKFPETPVGSLVTHPHAPAPGCILVQVERSSMSHVANHFVRRKLFHTRQHLGCLGDREDCLEKTRLRNWAGLRHAASIPSQRVPTGRGFQRNPPDVTRHVSGTRCTRHRQPGNSFPCTFRFGGRRYRRTARAQLWTPPPPAPRC